MIASVSLTLEIVLICISVVAFIGYHVILFIVIRYNKNLLSLNYNIQHRRAWSFRALRLADVTAVQTLRNYMIVASFLATSALAMALFVIERLISGTPVNIPQLDFTNSVNNQQFFTIKLMLLLLDLFFTFFSFSTGLRFAMHTSFLVTTRDKMDGVELAVHFPHELVAVSTMAERSVVHYWLGMRGYYTFFPLFFFIFGPTWLLVCTLVLILAMVWIDGFYVGNQEEKLFKIVHA